MDQLFDKLIERLNATFPLTEVELDPAIAALILRLPSQSLPLSICYPMTPVVTGVPNATFTPPIALGP